jgi:hypothetical protein
MRLLVSAIILFGLGFTFGALFSIDRWPAAIPQKQIELDLGKVEPVKPQSLIDREATALVIPQNLAPGSNGQMVGTQILDHNLKNLMQGRFFRNAELAQRAQEVQEVLRPSVGYTDASGVEHKLNLELEAFQGFAVLKYEGYLSSNLTFVPESKDFLVSVSDQIANSTRLSVEHDSKNETSWLRLNFGW